MQALHLTVLERLFRTQMEAPASGVYRTWNVTVCIVGSDPATNASA